jgi:hypothetical protein
VQTSYPQGIRAQKRCLPGLLESQETTHLLNLNLVPIIVVSTKNHLRKEAYNAHESSIAIPDMGFGWVCFVDRDELFPVR